MIVSLFPKTQGLGVRLGMEQGWTTGCHTTKPQPKPFRESRSAMIHVTQEGGVIIMKGGGGDIYVIIIKPHDLYAKS